MVTVDRPMSRAMSFKRTGVPLRFFRSSCLLALERFIAHTLKSRSLVAVCSQMLATASSILEIMLKRVLFPSENLDVDFL